MKNFEEFTVNEIIQSDYRARFVFKSLGIDFSTDKGKTLQEVCKYFKISPESILDKIIEEMEVKRLKPWTVTH